MFTLTAQYQRINLTGARGQEPYNAMVGVFQLSRVRRGAEAFHIARCDVNADVQIADVACDQGLVVDFATAEDAIHVVADQIHHPVAHAHIELDIRVGCVKSRKRRHQDEAGQRTGHINP